MQTAHQSHHDSHSDSESLALQYCGRATTLQIDTILDLLEKMMLNEGLANSLRRRIYCIAMEALQNLNGHVPDQVKDYQSGTQDINPHYIKFHFSESQGRYIIETTNYVHADNLAPFLSKIDHINNLNEAEKKEYYNYLIKNLPFSEKGGAGLGLVDIARKSKRPIRYMVQDRGGVFSLVTLSLSVEAEVGVSVPLS